MRLILTGACGHIGSYISKNIFKINKIKEIILIDNFNTQRYSSLFNLKKKIKVSFLNKDISKPGALDNLKNVNFIIHCASLTDAANSFLKKKRNV